MSFATRMASNDVQEDAIRTIERWCKRLHKSLVGGTCIGKYYDTVILDLTYNGSEIYIHSNGFEETEYGNAGVTVKGTPITSEDDFETFKQAIMED